MQMSFVSSGLGRLVRGTSLRIPRSDLAMRVPESLRVPSFDLVTSSQIPSQVMQQLAHLLLLVQPQPKILARPEPAGSAETQPHTIPRPTAFAFGKDYWLALSVLSVGVCLLFVLFARRVSKSSAAWNPSHSREGRTETETQTSSQSVGESAVSQARWKEQARIETPRSLSAARWQQKARIERPRNASEARWVSDSGRNTLTESASNHLHREAAEQVRLRRLLLLHCIAEASQAIKLLQRAPSQLKAHQPAGRDR
jgi:hypothetical protein